MNETDHDRRRDELAAYLLGALEPGEAAELESHLTACESCREQLEWLRPAVQVLPESVPRAEPPAELRGRLLEQVRDEAGRTPSRAAPRGFQDGRRRLGPRPLAGLAATALVVAGLAGYAISGGSGGNGATTVAAGHAPGVTAEMVREGDSGTLHLAHLRQLPPDKVLEAWVRRGKRIVPAKALFVPNPDGTATATIAGMNGVNAVMVTAEPRGGSEQPTSAPIVSMTIPQ